MSAELVVVCASSSNGEQFIATVKVRGEYFDAQNPKSSGAFVGGASLDHPWHQALKRVGVEPYSPHSEAELRVALRAIGLGEAEIENKFQSARSFKSSFTVRQ